MSIKRTISLSINPEQSFKAFVYDFNDWWPKDYTWSQDSLREINIGNEQGELCTEIGPHDFRCDWGRVTKFIQERRIEFTWQISPNREPIPNPKYASNITVVFSEDEESGTVVEFEHTNFDKHGEEGKKYKSMLDSPQGWSFILNRYKVYCEKQIDQFD